MSNENLASGAFKEVCLLNTSVLCATFTFKGNSFTHYICKSNIMCRIPFNRKCNK